MVYCLQQVEVLPFIVLCCKDVAVDEAEKICIGERKRSADGRNREGKWLTFY